MHLPTWTWGQDVGRNMVISCPTVQHIIFFIHQPCISHASLPRLTFKLVPKKLWWKGFAGPLDQRVNSRQGNRMKRCGKRGKPNRWWKKTTDHSQLQFDWLGKNNFLYDAIIFLKNGNVLVGSLGVDPKQWWSVSSAFPSRGGHVYYKLCILIIVHIYIYDILYV